MENNSNVEKFFSIQEVLNLTATLIGSQPQDLIEKIEDNDLSNIDSLQSFIKPFAVKHLNKIREESVNKGYRQASKKTERLWGEVFQEDITGKRLEDLFMEKKNQTNSDKSKKEVTLQQALNSLEVREHLKGLEQKVKEYDILKNEYSSYRNLINVKSDALEELNKQGAKFSDNEKIKKLQLKALEDSLSSLKYRRNDDNSITILDEDGESPLYNKDTADHWKFGDYIKSISPVDFVSDQPKKKDKKTFVPSGNKSSSLPFGYSPEQIKNFKYEDFDRAKKSGNNEEAKFIQEQMVNNYENS